LIPKDDWPYLIHRILNTRFAAKATNRDGGSKRIVEKNVRQTECIKEDADKRLIGARKCIASNADGNRKLTERRFDETQKIGIQTLVVGNVGARKEIRARRAQETLD